MTQKFKISDRVQFVAGNKHRLGVIVSEKDKNSYIVEDDHDTCIIQKHNLAPAPVLVVVPSFIDDYIKNSPHLTSYGAIRQVLHPDSTENILADELVNWVARYPEKFARAWLDGYEVEKEPLYYVKVLNRGLGYLNCDTGAGEYFIDSRNNDDGIKTQYTETEIKALNEKLWECAVPVEEEA